MRNCVSVILAAMLAMFGSAQAQDESTAKAAPADMAPAADAEAATPRFCSSLQQGYMKNGDVAVICQIYDLQVDLATIGPERSPGLSTIRTGKVGDLLYRETASYSTRFVQLEGDVSVNHRSIQLVIPADTVLRVFKIGGGYAFCRFLGKVEKGKRKSPEIHCLFDTNADGFVDQFQMRKKNFRRLIRKTEVNPVRYRFVEESPEQAGIVKRTRKKKLERGVILASLSPDEAVLEIPVFPTEFAADGTPKDDTSAFAEILSQKHEFKVPLVDGKGSITHRGMTLEIQQSDGKELTYTVTSGFDSWYQ